MTKSRVLDSNIIYLDPINPTTYLAGAVRIFIDRPDLQGLMLRAPSQKGPVTCMQSIPITFLKIG